MEDLRLDQGVRVAFLIAAVNALGAVNVFVAHCRAVRHGRTFSLKRTLKLTVASALLWQGLLVAILWIYHRTGGWTWSSVGVSESVHPLVAFPGGCLVYVGFAYAVRALFARTGREVSYLQACVRANAAFLQRDPVKRGVVLAVLMIVNPITEELIFRGLLVHQFALVAVPVWAALIVGCVLNAINHAYQGRLLGWFHLGFYVASVATLYSPLGMIGCFGLHFAGDLMPFVRQRSNVARYVVLRRRARGAKSSAREVSVATLDLLPRATSRTDR